MKNRTRQLINVVKISTIILGVIFVSLQNVLGQGCPTTGTLASNTTCTSAITGVSGLIIPAGVTYTVASISVSGTLTVNGTLIVTSGAASAFYAGNGSNIKMGVGGGVNSNALIIVGPVGNSSANEVFYLHANSKLDQTSGTIIVNGTLKNQNTNDFKVGGTILVNGNFTQGGSPNLIAGAGAVIQATGTFSGGQINGTNVSTIIGTCTSNCGFPSNACTFTSSASPSTVACTGSSTITASITGGSGSPTYQWEYTNSSLVGWQTISGATSVSYSATNINQATDYRCLISRTGCSTGYSSVSLVNITGSSTPSVSVSASQTGTICSGNTVTFTATPTNTGGGTVNYDFLKNGVSVQSSSSNTFTTSSLTTGNTITCKITISGGTCITSTTAISNTLTMTVSGSTTITSQPSNLSRCAGTSATFAVTATAGTFQWQENTGTGFVNITNGGIYSGATSALLGISSPTIGMNGYTYRCVVTSGCSSPSNSATLTVNPIPSTPTISAGTSTTFCTGGSVLLTSSAGSGNQWYLAGSPIGSATSTTYSATTAGVYTVVSTVSACSSATSAGTTVTVNPIPSTPTISAGTSTTFCTGGSVLLTSSAGTGNQWYLAGSPIGSATSTTYSATTAGVYTVVSTVSACSSATSAGTTVTVNPIPSTPTISAGTSTTFCTGGSVLLTSNAGSGNQWYLAGSPIGSATSTTYSATTAGVYTVVSTVSACSSATSAGTTVTVNPIPSTPTISAGTSTTFCTGGSVLLTSSAGFGNQWYLAGSPIGSATSTTYSATTAGVYTVVSTVSACSSATSAGTTVTVNPIPSTPATPTLAAVCSGSARTLAATGTPSGTFFWYVDPIAGTGRLANNTSVSPTSTKTYYLIDSVGATSCKSARVSVVLNVNALPVVTSASSICVGVTSVILSPTTGGTWSSSDGTKATVTNAGSVSGIIAGSPTFTFTETATGCSKTTNVVAVYARPSSATIAGTATICSGNSTNLTVTLVGGSGLYSIDYTGGTLSNYASGTVIPVSPVSTTTYILNSVFDSNGCEAVSLTGNPTVTLDAPGRWVGITSAWQTPSNWCGNAVPTSTTDVSITSGSGPIISTTNASVNSISIGSGMSVQIDNAHILQVYGNWTNTGTFTPNLGTVEFLGTSAQSITNSGTENFYNLTVNKSSGTLTVNANTNILSAGSGTLSVQSGTIDVAASKKITFKSAAPIAQVDQTARLGRVGGTITPTSTFEMERYIGSPNARLPYVYATNGRPAPTIFLAPSMQGVTAAQWSDDMLIKFRTSGSTLVSYSELNGSGVTLQDRIDGGWRSISSASTALTSGIGYRVFAGLDNSVDIVSVSGSAVVGNFSTPVTYTPNATEGWNLLGNPYACEINFDDLYSANSSVISPSMHIMDPYNTSTGGTSYDNTSYITYNSPAQIVADPRTRTNGVGTTRTATNAKFIASSQAFFVNATTNGFVNFTESMKPVSPYTSVYGNFREETKELIRLDYSDSVSKDQAVVHFNQDATNGYDIYDALSLSSTIYTTVGDKKLAINGQGGFDNTLRIPLVVSGKVLGKKSITISEQTLVGKTLYLFDNYKKVMVKLENGTKYNFEHTSDADSRSVSRFVLTSAKPVITEVDVQGNSTMNTMEIHPNPYTNGILTLDLKGSNARSVDVEVMDLKGNVIFTTTLTSRTGNGSTFELNPSEMDLSSGVYAIKCVTSTKTFTQRLVVTK